MPHARKVLITGASGYLAKHIVLQLLLAGHFVRASLRSANRALEVQDSVRPHLPHGFDLKSRLEFVTLNLMDDKGWREASTGVDALIHTASPFPIVQPSDPTAVIAPAVQGTMRALRAAKNAGVERTIVTGSSVSILNRDHPADRPYDERDWSEPGYKTMTPYGVSKLRAERAAWAFVQDEAPLMQLTVINPGFIVGRPLDRHYGTSLKVIERLLKGSDPMVPNVGFVCVDVGDVARMHVRALDVQEAGGRRIAAMARFITLAEMAAALKRHFPNRRLPTRIAPNWFIRALSLFDKSIATIVPTLGRREIISNERARTLLGMDFRDPVTSIVEAGEFIVESRIV